SESGLQLQAMDSSHVSLILEKESRYFWM
ncbi:unnamed protein product, partial [Allacma fusca]